MSCMLNRQGMFVCGSGVSDKPVRTRRGKQQYCRTDWMCERTCERGTRTCYITHPTSDTSGLGQVTETTGENNG